MSKLEVDTIAPQSGTQITLGESGDTITIPAGATFDASSGTLTLADGSVTNAKLAGSITNDKLTNSSITINGSSVSLGGSTTIETGTSWQSTIVTGTTLSAVAGNGYWIDTTSNACTVTLPGSASVGDTIEFVDYARTWNTNAITINPNSLNYQGNSSPNPEYNTDGQHVRIVYSGATQGWIPTVDDDVTLETPQSYDAEYLVVAGGASGSSTRGGGGGAGGYLTNFGGTAIGLSPGTTYTITVGAGGSGVSSARGNNGNNSVISGSGFSTITAIGGGTGGFNATDPDKLGVDGGSGGGGAGSSSGDLSGGSGTSPQGNDGGDGFSSSNFGCGGGGGSASAGGNGSSPAGGNGGNGTSNSITGSAVYYGAGGGGSIANGFIGGNGGTGNPPGYGEAGVLSATGQDGRPETGSGAGGADSGTSGSGGGGIVILRMATADYSGTTTGSPTVTTDGTDTIIKFTGSGSYTG